MFADSFCGVSDFLEKPRKSIGWWRPLPLATVTATLTSSSRPVSHRNRAAILAPPCVHVQARFFNELVESVVLRLQFWLWTYVICVNLLYVFTSSKCFCFLDTCYILSFAIIMLNTSLHNPNVKDKTTLERFISMNRGINNGEDLPNDLLSVTADSQTLVLTMRKQKSLEF